jgi:hypothetical protein
LAIFAVLAGLAGTCPGAVAVAITRADEPVPAARAVGVPAVDRMPVVRPVWTPPKVQRWRTLPDGTRTLLPGHRVVAFYGAPHAPGLGVLGAASPDDIWPRLHRQAKPYETAHTPVMTSYELITYLATGSRGNQGNFSSRLSDRTITHYAQAAKRHHALLILDIQPGRGRFLPDARSLKPWLRLPYVGLAIDPEWKLYGGQMPLSGIGHTSARVVNRVSRWLNHLTRVNHLPQKMFLVHQFTDSMVRDKKAVVARKHLATVFNVDGLGGRAAKIGKYRDFAQDRRFPLGFKLFYDADVGLMDPADVMRLRPRPAIVEYE